MMKGRLNFSNRRSEAAETTSTASPMEWEMRPGGMLVQKRTGSSGVSPPPNLRIRVAYGALRYQISANSLSTFGELKKLLAAETGLEAAEQRLIFKGKERGNGEYLDRCGVKDRSKVVLMEDPESRERRRIETRRNAEIQAINELIDGVTMEVDRLAEQVNVMEKSIGNGNKVAELQITTVTEMLMRQAVKLDNIPSQGDDASSKKDSLGKRVQKCVETLDVLKVSNAKQKVQPPLVVWEIFEPSHSATQWELFD